MKKSFLLLVLMSPVLSYCSFEFINNKEDGALARSFIEKLIEAFAVDIFFETGTYNCATTINAASYFPSVFTVELHRGLFEKAKARLAPYHNVKVFLGDSPDIIRQIAPTLRGNVLFWLDAHCSGQGTALNGNDDFPDAVTAIRGELQAIKESHVKNCVILIDDIRDFGTTIRGQEFLGCWAYPSLQDVCKNLLEINPNFAFALLGDMFLAYDKLACQPKLSETVIACTKTRLYDGSNATNDELLRLEEKIKNAPSHEKDFIKNLYLITTERKDPLFWHDLWYGLTELGSGNKKNALDVFFKVPARVQYLNKVKQRDNTVIKYDHPRIEWYKQQCLL